MKNQTSEDSESSPLYVARYKPEVTYDSVGKAIRSTTEFQKQHPTPDDVCATVGRPITSLEATDAKLWLELGESSGLLIENTGTGAVPTIRVAGRVAVPGSAASLGAEARLAWLFPDGDPAGNGPERSDGWTWYRGEELDRLLGLRLTEVMLYPDDVSLYFHDERHILTLESVYREDSGAPVLLWNWYEWRGACPPEGRPSRWP